MNRAEQKPTVADMLQFEGGKKILIAVSERNLKKWKEHGIAHIPLNFSYLVPETYILEINNFKGAMHAWLSLSIDNPTLIISNGSQKPPRKMIDETKFSSPIDADVTQIQVHIRNRNASNNLSKAPLYKVKLASVRHKN